MSKNHNTDKDALNKDARQKAAVGSGDQTNKLEENKSEAQKEKSDAQKEKREAEQPNSSSPDPFPRPNFTTFIFSLASSALYQLGEAPNPETGAIEKNLPMAQHTIDILQILQEKTQNNLSEDEKKLLDGLLYELRLKYISKK